MAKKSKQRFKFLENEETIQDELKIIFLHFKGFWLKQIFLEGESRTLNSQFTEISSIFRNKEVRK